MAFSLDSKVKDILKIRKRQQFWISTALTLQKSTDETGWWSDLTETGIFPAVGIFETTSGRTGKRASGNRIIFKKEAASNLETVSFFELKSGNIFLCEVDHKLFRHGIGQTSAEKLTFDHIDGSNCIDADDIFCCCVAR